LVDGERKERERKRERMRETVHTQVPVISGWREKGERERER
jgi:hypothetical protein